MKKLVIPAGVTKIGNHVFRNSLRSATLIMLPVVPPTYNGSSGYTIWSNSSMVTADYPMYVPDGSLEAYQTANRWSEKANYMKEMSEYPG